MSAITPKEFVEKAIVRIAGDNAKVFSVEVISCLQNIYIMEIDYPFSYKPLRFKMKQVGDYYYYLLEKLGLMANSLKEYLKETDNQFLLEYMTGIKTFVCLQDLSLEIRDFEDWLKENFQDDLIFKITGAKPVIGNFNIFYQFSVTIFDKNDRARVLIEFVQKNNAYFMIEEDKEFEFNMEIILLKIARTLLDEEKYDDKRGL